MSSNGHAVRASLAPGHFLFTSESVGEGHPGMFYESLNSWTVELMYNQIKFVIRCLMLLYATALTLHRGRY